MRCTAVVGVGGGDVLCWCGWLRIGPLDACVCCGEVVAEECAEFVGERGMVMGASSSPSDTCGGEGCDLVASCVPDASIARPTAPCSPECW